jgi:HAD superfamily hydrolase (TIGR01484 family)
MSRPREEHLLACDLDGTLIPTTEDRSGIARFRDALAGWEGVVLAYVTGRHLALAEEGIQGFGLPEPRWLACDVGTSLYSREKGGFHPDQDFRTLLLERGGGWSAREIRERLTRVEGVALQEEEKQGEFKASFLFDPRVEAVLREDPALTEAFSTRVWSLDPITGEGLLDVLPPGAGKADALRYLQDRHGLTLDQVTYAGDSGNDRDALLLGGFGILMANAPEGLVEEIQRDARRLGITHRIHLPGNPFADGVVEGVRHFRRISEAQGRTTP